MIWQNWRGSTLSRSGDPAIDVEILSNLSQLAKYSREWDQLVFQSAGCRPQAAFSYVAPQLEHLNGSGVRWACLVARCGDCVEGILPFLIKRKRWVGPVLEANPIDADLVIKPGREQSVVPALLRHLSRVVPGWIYLKFGDVRAGSPTVDYFDSSSHYVLTRAAGRSRFLRLRGTYEDFLNDLPGPFRRNLRRLSKKFFALSNARVEFITSAQCAEKHLCEFVRVEGSGWKARDGNAIRLRSELQAYYRDVTDHLAASGVLEWHVLRVGSHAVAMNLVVRMGRTLVLDKIAYDESWAEYAPGNILISNTIERACASGDVDEVDFLSDYDWNRRWGAEARDCYDISIFNPSPLGLALGYAPAAIRRRAAAWPVAHRARDRLRNVLATNPVWRRFHQ